MSLKSKRWLLFFVMHPGPLVLAFAIFPLAVITNSDTLAMLSGGLCCGGLHWLLLGFWPAWLLSRAILVQLCRTLKCPCCGFEFDAVGRWSVGDYTDHAERHILNARNPIDGGRIGHIACPKCDSTILVQ
ncbi:MAG: hypothetical protein M3552_06805 [Planctomycetota bacterium]|nr:hypothetical protein [Planctomycetaceae bacterium]MDQ3330346.1 hypothetical protein [Planctomycetota bacterium]